MAAIPFNTLVARPGGSNPGFSADIDFTVATPVGMPIPVFPFLQQGDATTVYFTQPFEQGVSSYQPPDLKGAMPGVPGAFNFGDVNFRDLGAGIYRFERKYGNIPAQRIVLGQSYKYPFQYVLNSGAKLSGVGTDNLSYEGPTYSIGTEPTTVDSILVMDYFMDGDQNEFPLLHAPKLVQVGQNIDPVGVDFKGGAFPLTLQNGLTVAISGVTQMLADDDYYGEYQGAVKCRIRRLIAAPTLAFWINGA